MPHKSQDIFGFGKELQHKWSNRIIILRVEDKNGLHQGIDFLYYDSLEEALNELKTNDHNGRFSDAGHYFIFSNNMNTNVTYYLFNSTAYNRLKDLLRGKHMPISKNSNFFDQLFGDLFSSNKQYPLQKQYPESLKTLPEESLLYSKYPQTLSQSALYSAPPSYSSLAPSSVPLPPPVSPETELLKTLEPLETSIYNPTLPSAIGIERGPGYNYNYNQRYPQQNPRLSPRSLSMTPLSQLQMGTPRKQQMLNPNIYNDEYERGCGCGGGDDRSGSGSGRADTGGGYNVRSDYTSSY